MSRESMSYVYVIAAIDGEVPVAPCKIGITRNLKSRLSGIQNGNPKKLQLISAACLPNRDLVEVAEKTLHWQFEDFRLEGEWFDICPVDASIGVALTIHMVFENMGLAGDDLHNALHNLGITQQLADCRRFLDICKAKGWPIKSRLIDRADLADTPAEGSA